MVAAVASEPAVEKEAYKSPKHAQVWFLKRSRDLWKKKYQALKVEAKRWQNRVADVTKSRDKWRAQAEDAQRRLAEAQRHNADLQAQLDPLRFAAGKKGAP
jgi:chromosome segregation ATPase